MLTFNDLVQFDYVVKVFENCFLCVESYEGNMTLIRQLQQELEGKVSHLSLGGNQLTIYLSPAHDKIAFAERISAYLEAEGKIVTRLVPDPSASDRTPAKAVQSFILA